MIFILLEDIKGQC